MSVIEIYYDAKCKDCKYIEQFRNEKNLKRNRCSNPVSRNFKEQITLRHKSCDKFVLKGINPATCHHCGSPINFPGEHCQKCGK